MGIHSLALRCKWCCSRSSVGFGKNSSMLYQALSDAYMKFWSPLVPRSSFEQPCVRFSRPTNEAASVLSVVQWNRFFCCNWKESSLEHVALLAGPDQFRDYATIAGQQKPCNYVLVCLTAGYCRQAAKLLDHLQEVAMCACCLWITIQCHFNASWTGWPRRWSHPHRKT